MPSEDVLAGKVALVTGASRGIGFAIARRLGQMGARVSICGRDQEKLDHSASRLRGEGIETLAIQADVARGDQVAALIHRTQQESGPIDILVNNAGTGLFGPFHEFGEAEWDTILDTNLKSVFLVCRAVTPEMIAFMLRRTSGIICAPLTEARATELDLPMMVAGFDRRFERASRSIIAWPSRQPTATSSRSFCSGHPVDSIRMASRFAGRWCSR